MTFAKHEHPTLEAVGVSLRPTNSEDLDLLATWFAEPENYRWWGGTALTREVVAEKYLGRRCPRVESFLIESSGEPIGYMQYYLDGPGQAGLDMMLVPRWRGRGFGPRAARLLIDYLVEARGWTDLTVDPAIGNMRAIHAWEKAGFVRDRDWPDHPDGPAVLMRLRSDEHPRC
jgi:aminoglycoside 6'-N-acetyltransferase